MSTVVSDLVARVRSEGVAETATAVKAVGDQAAVTARALEIMAQQAAKVGGGTSQGWLENFQRSGAQPTAAALSEAAKSMEQTAAAAQKAVVPTQTAAKAAADHATATKSAALAAEEVHKGWTASESSLVRFGAGLAGVGLGISLVAGAARLVHDAVEGIVTSQLDWERSLVSVHALYGAIGPQVLATAQAQALAPGLAGTAQDFTQAALNARYLSSRYGLAQGDITSLTSAAGRAASTLNLNPGATQAAFLQAAETGGTGLRTIIGTELDPLSVARRLGGVSAGQIEALTPAQLREARVQMIAQDAARLSIFGSQDRPGLLAAQTTAEKVLSVAQTNLTSALEGARGPSIILSPTTGERALTQQILQYGLANPAQPPQPTPLDPVFTKAVQDAQAAFEKASAAVGDNVKALADSSVALEKMGITAGTATFRLMGFTGSIEDPRSIARGDIASQAQAAVAARARSATPVLGMGSIEIGAIARGTAWQQAYQNFVAVQAQRDQDNGIQEWLQKQGPAGAAAIAQARQLEPINRGIGQATTRAAQIDLATADTQAKLEAISLTQRERYVQLMRDTVDLRKLDVQQQQVGLAATMDVIRAQQATLPSQQVSSAARYQQNLASALSQQRMARLLQGQDVSGLPNLNELINMNYQGQLIEGENAPAAVTGARRVEVASQTATAAGLAQALTEGQIRGAEMANDLKNLGDIPAQTALEVDLLQNNRDQLSVQTELREYLKALVYIMSAHPPQSVPSDRGDRVDAYAAPPAPSDLPGARHQ